VLFLAGISFQAVILGVTFYFLHEVHQKSELVFEEEEVSLERGINIPFAHYVMGEGKVACSNYVKVTAKREGIMEDLFVEEGDAVRLGDSLFQMDDGVLRFAFREKLAEYESSLAEVKWLEKGASEFDLRVKEKEIEQIQIRLFHEEKERNIFIDLFEKNAISESEKERQETLVQIAFAQKEKVLAEYQKLKAGPSNEEKEVKRAQLREKEVAMRSAEKALSECSVLSPIEGRVLKVKTQPGEYIRLGDEAVVIGSEHPLHLRVLIDEKDIWRISPAKNLRAIAIHRMNPKIYFIPNFIAIKQSSNEGKVEILFAFDKGNAPIYLDQALDVYIEAASIQDTSYLDYQFNQMR